MEILEEAIYALGTQSIILLMPNQEEDHPVAVAVETESLD